MNKIYLIFLAVFFVSFFTFLLHYQIVGDIVWGDGQYYYAHLRSFWIDHDLDSSNELGYFKRSVGFTKTGYAENRYSIGPAVLWSPFFLLAHLILRSDGYSGIYQIFTGVSSILYALIGLWLCFLLSKKYFNVKIALISTLLIWFSTNLFFYSSVDPINSHALSFFIASLVVYLTVTLPLTRVGEVLLVGFLVGLLGIIRNQDLVFILLPLIKIGFNKRLIPFFVCLFIAFVPQLFVWNFIYGQVNNPYLIEGEKFNFTNPQIFAVLFGTSNGLFIYSPLIILSLIGLYHFRKKSRFLGIGGILLFVSELLIISSWHSFTQGASYGGRMFLSLGPLFILGLAAFLDKIRLKDNLLYLIAIFFIVMNFILIFKFLLLNP